jgi:type IV pilus assembly protein PilP
MIHLLRRGSFLVLVASLVGCSVSGEDELRTWMTEQRNLTRPKVPPISEPKQFKPDQYGQEGTLEPFSKVKLTQALKQDSAQAASNAALVAPELARRKEPLEAYPLDTMTLVGQIVQSGQVVGLLKVDNLLYQVRPGSYLGQNYGKIVKITETEITLREIVQDAVGEWIERTATLQLQERSK